MIPCGSPPKVFLRPVESSDLSQLRKWRNDYRIWKWCRQNDLLSESQHQGWYKWQAEDRHTKMYSIEGQSGLLLGCCGLTSIDHMNKRAEFSLFIDPELQRRGFALSALKGLLTVAFMNYGLSTVWGETFDENPAIKLFEKVGFAKEGTRRQFYLREGKLIDAHLYSITRDEFKP